MMRYNHGSYNHNDRTRTPLTGGADFGDSGKGHGHGDYAAQIFPKMDFSKSRGRGTTLSRSSGRDLSQQNAHTGNGYDDGMNFGNGQNTPAGRIGNGGGGFDMNSSGQSTGLAGRGRGGHLNVSYGQHNIINGQGRGGGNNFGLSNGFDIPLPPKNTTAAGYGRGGGMFGLSSDLVVPSAPPVPMHIQNLKNEVKPSPQVPNETIAKENSPTNADAMTKKENRQPSDTYTFHEVKMDNGNHGFNDVSVHPMTMLMNDTTGNNNASHIDATADLAEFMRRMSTMCAEFATRLEHKNGH